MRSHDTTFIIRTCPFCQKPFKSYETENRLKCHRPACIKTRGITKGAATIQERFWSKVDKSAGPDACWLWNAAKYSNGYGHLGMGKKGVLAHRLSYELAYGEGSIPEGLQILHTCPNNLDRPDCVNPKHLRPGTAAENNFDMMSRGRHNPVTGDRAWMRKYPERVPRGEAAGNTKLTADIVREIQARRATIKESMRATGKVFNISGQAVRDIITGRTWKHITNTQ